MKLAAVSSELKVASAEATSLGERLAKERQLNAELQAPSNRLQTESTQLRARAQSLEADCCQLQLKLSLLEEQHAELQQKLDQETRRANFEAAQKKAAAADLTNLEQTITDLRAQLAAAQLVEEQLRGRLSNGERADASLADMAKRLAASEAEVCRLTEVGAALEAQNYAAVAERDAAVRHCREADAHLALLSSRVAELEAQVAALEELVGQLREQLRQAKTSEQQQAEQLLAQGRLITQLSARIVDSEGEAPTPSQESQPANEKLFIGLDPSQTGERMRIEMEQKLNAGFPRVFLDDILSGKNMHERAWDLLSVAKVLETHRLHLKLVFRYYLSHGFYKTERRHFAMNLTQFRTFLRDCQCSTQVVNETGLIFKICNMPRDSAGNMTPGAAHVLGTNVDEPNPDLEMLLSEFVEGIVRAANVQYPTAKWLHEKVHRFLTANVIPHSKVFKPDNFRKAVVRNSSVQEVLRTVARPLSDLFERVSMLDKDDRGGRKSMNVKEFFLLLKQAEILDDSVTVVRASHIFMLANYEEDDLSWRDWDWDLNFEEFLDVLVRIFLTRTGQGKLQEGMRACGESLPTKLMNFFVQVSDYHSFDRGFAEPL